MSQKIQKGDRIKSLRKTLSSYEGDEGVCLGIKNDRFITNAYVKWDKNRGYFQHEIVNIDYIKKI